MEELAIQVEGEEGGLHSLMGVVEGKQSILINLSMG